MDRVRLVYVSMVAVATLGLGDILSATPLLRIVVPLEALVGFVLLTAGISWVLQPYPELIRRRAAREPLALPVRRHPNRSRKSARTRPRATATPVE